MKSSTASPLKRAEESGDAAPEITITRRTLDLEKVIAEKNPALFRVIPKLVLRYLKRVIHLDQLNEGLYRMRGRHGVDFVRAALDMFHLNIPVKGIAHLRAAERPIVVANHPLGGLDGMAIISVVGREREVVVPVNDLLMYLPNLRELFVPVNKHGSNLRNVQVYDGAYASEKTVIHFPAGLCSRRKGGRVRDLRWQKSFVAKARKHGRSVVPAWIGGENSRFFYTLANLRRWFSVKANIEMLYLVDEMFKQTSKTLPIVFGRPIPHTVFDQRHSDWEWARKLRAYVYRLARDENAFFFAEQP